MISPIFQSVPTSRPLQSWWQQGSRAECNAWCINGVPKYCVEYMILVKNKMWLLSTVMGSLGAYKLIWKAISKKELINAISTDIIPEISAQPPLWRAILIWIYQFWPLGQKFRLITACLHVWIIVVADTQEWNLHQFPFSQSHLCAFLIIFRVVIPCALNFKRGGC